MMKTMKFFSMAALALVGAVMTGCSSDDDIIETQQPANGDKVITVKTTVSLDNNVTRALDPATGVKTFAASDKISVVYQQQTGSYDQVFSDALESGDVGNGGKTATFTFTLTNPKNGGYIAYIYPGVEGATSDDLYTKQDGTLETLQSQFDHAFGDGTMTVDGNNVTLPNITLANQKAILALKIKDDKGTADTNDDVDITSSITSLTIVLGVGESPKSYTINRTSTDGTIYVAVDQVYQVSVEITATTATKTYTKSLTNKTYETGHFYNYIWKMTEAAAPSGPEAVDLGEGVSVLWANMNVGATSPEGYGDYFAWGETEPYYSSQDPLTWKTGKEAGYDWPSYAGKFGTFDQNAIPGNGMTKYNTTDGLGTLVADDDAATANWQNGWRMPTQAEFNELLQAYPASTTSGSKRCAWVTNYNNTGVNGLAFYDAEDNIKLFLPAAGNRNNTILQVQGEFGLYWSSSVGDLGGIAPQLLFGSEMLRVSQGSRNYGYPVRPVRAK